MGMGMGTGIEAVIYGWLQFLSGFIGHMNIYLCLIWTHCRLLWKGHQCMLISKSRAAKWRNLIETLLLRMVIIFCCGWQCNGWFRRTFSSRLLGILKSWTIICKWFNWWSVWKQDYWELGYLTERFFISMMESIVMIFNGDIHHWHHIFYLNRNSTNCLIQDSFQGKKSDPNCFHVAKWTKTPTMPMRIVSNTSVALFLWDSPKKTIITGFIDP